MENRTRINLLALREHMKKNNWSIEPLKQAFRLAESNINYNPTRNTINAAAKLIGIEPESFQMEHHDFKEMLSNSVDPDFNGFSLCSVNIRNNRHLWEETHKSLVGTWRLYTNSSFEKDKYFVSSVRIGALEPSGIHIDIKTPVERNHGFEQEIVHFHGRIYPVNEFLYAFCERIDKPQMGQIKSFTLQTVKSKDNLGSVKALYGHEVFMGDMVSGTALSSGRRCYITRATSKDEGKNIWGLRGKQLGYIEKNKLADKSLLSDENVLNFLNGELTPII